MDEILNVVPEKYMAIGMHNPSSRQKTNHIQHGAQLCASYTVVILDIRVTKYLPLGIRA